MKLVNNVPKFMRKITTVAITAILLVTSLGMNPIITHAQIEEPDVNKKEVLDFEDVSVHDPSVIKVDDAYYIFGSHVTGAKSNDLKNWENFANQDMENNTLFGNIQENLKDGFAWSGDINATHLDELGIWAPDVIHNPNYVNEDGSKGAYLMYLSMSSGEHYRSSIALAVSNNVEGPYEYVDTIVYSGFTNIEGEEHWSNTNFNTEFENGEPRSGYFRSNGSFNFDLFPNAIDPVIVDGKDGKQYMSYGSWNGGIYILEIDQETGMPIRQENYNGGKADNGGDSYFGVKISGGYRTSGEGPYIVYDEETDYYHYYVTYGFLTQESEYNMRFFRSKNIYGPYEDSEGNNPNFSKKTDNQNYGNKLMGSFEFKEEQAVDKDAKFFGYRVPGHNTIYQDKETGQTFNIFHTRFKDKGEGHEVRVHQMFFDEDGWPLMAPQRYNGEEILKDSDLNVGGSILLVDHDQDNNKHSKESFGLSLNKDGSISGALEGTWNFKAGIMNLTLGEDTYRGFVLEQSTPITGWTKDLTYTLLGTSDKVKGQALHGIRITDKTDKEVFEKVYNELALEKTENITSDINLPLKTSGGISIAWSSSDESIISKDGKVNRGDDSQTVTLTATLTYGKLTGQKTFEVSVAQYELEDYLNYDFNGSLEEKKQGFEDAKTVGVNTESPGGKEEYRTGIVRDEDNELQKALYFDGTTGVSLPDNLLDGDTYTISYWINPDEHSMHVPTFFALSEQGWLSVPSFGWNEELLVWARDDINDRFYDGITGKKAAIDAWTHISLAVDKTNIKVYIDGDLMHDGDGFPEYFANKSTPNKFYLGVNPFPDAAFKGLMDDLRIYQDRQVSGQEIKEYYESVTKGLTPAEQADLVFNAIDLGESTIVKNIDLPLLGKDGIKIDWNSSNPHIISNKGIVNRPNPGKKDVDVKLSAKIEIDGETFTKEYILTVKAMPLDVELIHYEFDKSLSESQNKSYTAKTTGDQIDQLVDKKIQYKDGILGSAVYLDGSTGLRLPDGLIRGNQYTLSMWLKPEELVDFSTAFFGAQTKESWISVLPQSGHSKDTMIWSGEEWFDGITGKTIPVDAWSNLTLAVNNGEVSFYIDGQLAHHSTNFPKIFKNDESSVFGVGVNYWDTPFKGLVDDLIIYPKTTLNKKEINEYIDSVLSTQSPEEIAKNIFSSINFGSDPLTSNIKLPKTSNDGRKITWKTSNPHIINLEGKVTRPKAGEKDVGMRLTASVTIDGKTFNHNYEVKVKAEVDGYEFLHYEFEKSIKDSNNKNNTGKITGDRIDNTGGLEAYKEGISGNALVFDGATGLRLPDNTLNGNEYTISLWLNPSELNNFTTSFFGAQDGGNWLSILPKGIDDQTMVWSGEQWYDGMTGKTIPINAWSHLALSVKGGKVSFYIDGALAHEGTGFPEIFNKKGNSIFALGVNHWDVPFKGLMDDLRIYPDNALSSTEINSYRNEILSKLDPETLANRIFDSIVLGKDGIVTSDLNLPLKGDRKSTLTWLSSNDKFISNAGKVTRPNSKQGDQKVRLRASLFLEGQKFVRDYNVVVKAKTQDITSISYSFDKTLNDSSKSSGLAAKLTGDRIDNTGGKIKYKKGKVGDGVYLDGSYGLRLPDGLLKSNEYSVSMWMKPEELTDFTSVFFGAQSTDSWVSIVPKSGHNGQTMVWSGEQWYDGITGTTIPVNRWSHVALTVKNGTVNVYIDGELRHQGSEFPNLFNDKTEAIFGLGVNYWDIPFKGIVDELKIEAKKAISAKSISEYYEATVGDSRFDRNTKRTLHLDFENNIGAGSITGDRIDNQGGKITYEEGVLGQAAYFDGNTGIRLPEGQITSDRYSVQMWVNPEEITDFSTMFFGGSSNSNWVSFPMSAIDGKTMLWSGENWYDAITPKRIPQDRWSHLAATVDKGKVNVYIDGEIMFSGDDFPDVFNSPDTFAGIGVNFWDAPFKGLMDEFTIHNNAVVSASTIKEYYEDTKPEQEDFERNQEKTHIFKFEESLKDSENEELEGIVVGSKLDLEGGNIEYRDGKFGKAVYFDGESGIRLPDELITSEDYSVSLWINPEEIQPHTTTFFGAQNDGSWLSVVPESGETTEGNTMVWSGTEWYDGNLGSQIPIDEWSHIIFKVEEGSLFAYLNGEKVFEGDEFPDIFIEEKSVFSLGVNYWDEAFKGMIDELMVFDAHALSEEEIEDLFQGNFEEKSETDKIKEIDKKEDQKTSSNRPLIVAGVGIGIVGILAGVYQYVLKLKKDKNI